MPDPKKPAGDCLAEVGNADNLVNPAGLRPLLLSKDCPLEVKAFAKVAVVVSAKSYGLGKPLTTFGVLYAKRQEGEGFPQVEAEGKAVGEDVPQTDPVEYEEAP